MSKIKNVQFIIGGARSGKSRYAESLAKQAQLFKQNIVYIATAHSNDVEMQRRIEQHRQDRPAHWQTLEVDTDLASHLMQADAQTCLLIDCLTLWLLNLMEQGCAETEINLFLKALQGTNAQVICVSNEIGMGVVPMGKLTRQYVDELGRLHQKVAKIADAVTLMVAGIPMVVK